MSSRTAHIDSRRMQDTPEPWRGCAERSRGPTPRRSPRRRCAPLPRHSPWRNRVPRRCASRTCLHRGRTSQNWEPHRIRKCPSAGHLRVAIASRFALGGAVEFEDRVKADFPDSLGEHCRLAADSDLVLVFGAAQFALYGHMRTLGKSSGELSQPAEGIDAIRFAIPTFRRRSSTKSSLRAKTPRCSSRR